MKNKMCHDKRLFYDRQKEPICDSEWFTAEATGEKHYYWVQMHNGGKTVKMYTQALAELWTKRTGLQTVLAT